MATTKKRINGSLPEDIEKALARVARRDDVPQTTKAVYLIRLALEIDEDDVWNRIVEERDSPRAKFYSHKEVWK